MELSRFSYIYWIRSFISAYCFSWSLFCSASLLLVSDIRTESSEAFSSRACISSIKFFNCSSNPVTSFWVLALLFSSSCCFSSCCLCCSLSCCFCAFKSSSVSAIVGIVGIIVAIEAAAMAPQITFVIYDLFFFIKTPL